MYRLPLISVEWVCRLRRCNASLLLGFRLTDYALLNRRAVGRRREGTVAKRALLSDARSLVSHGGQDSYAALSGSSSIRGGLLILKRSKTACISSMLTILGETISIPRGVLS